MKPLSPNIVEEKRNLQTDLEKCMRERKNIQMKFICDQDWDAMMPAEKTLL